MAIINILLPSKAAFNLVSKSLSNRFSLTLSTNQQNASFTRLLPRVATPTYQLINKYAKFLEPQKVLSEQTRTITKFSYKSGKRKTCNAVIGRFFRLHWGIWIRTRAGRFKKLWKKSAKKRNLLRNHVFCNATQSRMLDKMVNKFWRKPRYYIEDPYAMYHSRENFHITQRKPQRPEGVDYE